MQNNLSDIEIEKMFNEDHHKKPSISKVGFKPLEVITNYSAAEQSIHKLNDVLLTLSVQLGATELSIRDILNLEAGSIVELNRLAGEPVDLFVNEKHFATGEVVIINEIFGFRINDLAPEEE